MTLLRMDNVLIVVDDLEAAIAFFTALGMQIEGQATVEGASVDRLVALEGVRSDIFMMRTPDGHGRIELDRFHTPPAIRAEPEDAPVNALGIRRIMFAVDDLDAVLAGLRGLVSPGANLSPPAGTAVERLAGLPAHALNRPTSYCRGAMSSVCASCRTTALFIS